MRRALFATTLGALLVLLPRPAGAAERRPVEGRWQVEDARFTEMRAYPRQHYFLVGEEGAALFRVDPADLELFQRCDVLYEIPEALETEADGAKLASVEGAVEAFRFRSWKPGTFPVAIRIESPDRVFSLTYEMDLVFVSDAESIPEPAAPAAPPMPEPSSVAPQGARENRPEALPPPGFARIWGLTPMYEEPGEDRRYMLRGIRLELWDSTLTTLLKTVNSSDDIGEGNCGIDMEDYLDTNTGAWVHVSDTGFFDFGEVAVGAGANFYIKEIFEFYAGANGTSATGVHRATVYDYDNSDQVVKITWNVGTVASQEDHYVGLYNSSINLSGTNGLVWDEAMHTLFDAARMYRFFRDCTGFWTEHVPFHLWLSDTGAPYSVGTDVYLCGWDNGYLNYEHTDSIRHEYAHAMHYRMRGGSMPPRAPGDVNHGNCSNSDSADALSEGFARYVPPVIYRDGVYHWTAGSTHDMAPGTNYCADPVPDDRHEWAVGPAFWKSWDNAGGTNAYLDCTTGSFYTRDEDYVEPTFNGMAADCDYDYELWAGFNHHSIDYDDTAPSNPSPVWVSPSGPWTNDNTPTWSWSTPWDDLSQIDGYGIYLVTWTGQPSEVKDIEEVTSYTPAALADGNSYYLNLRSVDNAGNWASGYTYGGPLGIDTVQPGAVSGLVSTSHGTGVWSQDLSLVMSWTAATDDRSGVDGYGLYTTTAPATPGTFKDIEEVTTYTESLSSSPNGWYFNMRTVDEAGNWDSDRVTAGPYYVDNVQPGPVSGLASTSHSTGVWSNDATIDFAWTAAADADSGIDGYGVCWQSTVCFPSAIKDIEEVTSFTQSASTSNSGYYFNLRSVDHAANWQPGQVSTGPYYVDTLDPSQPAGLISFTHPVGSCTTDLPEVKMQWAAAADAHSGLNGYSYTFSASFPQAPDPVIDLGPAATKLSQTLAYSTKDRYFNLSATDVAGNWTASVTYGPFVVDRSPEPASGLVVSQPVPDPEVVQLDWLAGAGSVSFQVERALDPAFGTYDSFPVPGKVFVDASPPAATLVFYRVRGVNSCGALGD